MNKESNWFIFLKVLIRCITIPLMFVWEAPQSILGLLFIFPGMKLTGLKKVIWKQSNIIIITSNMSGGISLGIFVFINDMIYDNYNYDKDDDYSNTVVQHEFGHCIQSRIFGPLYLLIIGIPSLLRANMVKSGKLKYENYFDGYPEKWADKLGEVDPSKRNFKR